MKRILIVSLIGFLVLTPFVFSEQEKALPENHELAKQRAEKLIREIVKGEEVIVEITLTEENFKQGKVEKISIYVEDGYTLKNIAELGKLLPKVKITKGMKETVIADLRIDKAVGEFLGVILNRDKLFQEKVEVESVQEARFYFRISQENLEHYLRKRNPLIQNLKVKLLPGRLELSGVIFIKEYMREPIRVKASANLTLRNKMVLITDISIEVVDLEEIAKKDPLTGYTLDILSRGFPIFISARYNPIINLEDFKFFKMDLEVLKIRDGYFEVYTKGMEGYRE